MLDACNLNINLFTKDASESPELSKKLLLTDDYKDGTLSLIGELHCIEGDRRTCTQILNNNIEQNFVVFDDIKESDEFREICYKMWTENILKNMSPLSSFIAYKKAINEVQLKSTFAKNIDKEENTYYYNYIDKEENAYYYNCIRRVKSFCDISRIESNINDIILEKLIYKIIIHAITAFECFEFAINYIETELEKSLQNSKWKCLMCEQIGDFSLINFCDNLKFFCVTIREDITDDEKEVKFQNFVIFEISDVQINISDDVKRVLNVNMTEEMIAYAMELIDYATANLTLGRMSHYILNNFAKQFQNSSSMQWNCFALKYSYLFPLSTNVRLQNGMLGAFKCREYSFVISNIEIYCSSNDKRFPFVNDNDLNNQNIDEYLTQIIVSQETEEFDSQTYESISDGNKKAIYDFCVSHSTKLVNTFEVKIANINEKKCIAIMDYERVGYTDRSFDLFYLKDVENQLCKMEIKWF